MSQRTLRLSLCFLLALCFAAPLAPDAVAGPRDRKIRKLKAELSTLERNVRQALQFRARYRNLKADLYFMQRLNRQDEKFYQQVIKYLNSPVSIFDAFLSYESRDYKRALQARNRYSPGRTTLWLKCRFGLTAVRSHAYYTVRVDVVDAQSGARIYQSLGPWQKRISNMITRVTLPIGHLRVSAGRYQLRISVEVAGRSVTKKIPFYYRTRHRRHYPHRRPAPGHRGIHSL